MAIMDYSLVQRIIDGLGKILDTKPGSPDEGTYVTEQQLADWIKGQTVVSAYYYNGVMYSDALHTTPITGQAGALYIDQDNNVLYRWDGAAWDAMSDNQLRQDILDGTVVAKKAECDEDGNNIKATYATKAEVQAADATLQSQVDNLDHRLENIEQSKGDYIVQSYKDGSTTPSGKGKWCVVEGVEGVSRVENNLMQYSTGYSQTNQYAGMFTHANALEKVNIVSGHKYLFLFVQPAGCALYRQNTTNLTLESGGTWSAPTVNTQMAFIATAGATAEETINSIVSKDETTATAYALSDMAICDLTIYFGGTIPSDAQTIADIQTNYPHLLLPSDYGTRIVDWTGNGVESGIDLVNGSIDGSGNDTPSDSRVRSSFVPVSGAITIAIDNPSAGQIITEAHYYNSAKSWLSYEAVSNTSKTLTIPSSCKYLKFILRNSNQTTTTPLEWAGKLLINNVHIERFLGVLSFPSTTLKSAGSVRDTLELNVEVEGVARRRDTQRIGTIDLSTISFSYNSGWNCWFGSAPSDIALPSSTTDVVNALWGGMIAVRSSGFTTQSNVNTFAINPSAMFFVNNGSTTVAPSGIMQYELADPVVTLSDPILDNTLLTESGGRLSTVQTGTVVDGIADLGFITL